MTRNSLMGMVAITGVILSASVAHAYIVPANALMDRAVKARLRLALSGLRLKGVLEKDGERSQVSEAIFREETGFVWRREIRRGEDVQIVLDRGRERYTFAPGDRGVMPSRTPLDPLAILGFPVEVDEDGIRGVEMLRDLGIDTSVVSYGRLDQRIVFIIGATSKEPNKPQLWLDKDLMVPVRLVRYDRSRVRVETRWLGFASPLTRPFFPRRIETWVDGQLTQSVTYHSIEVNPRLDETQFLRPS